MYHVRIFWILRPIEEAYDERDFSFGNFAEIGYWLDEYGYNEPEYRVEISFTRQFRFSRMKKAGYF